MPSSSSSAVLRALPLTELEREVSEGAFEQAHAFVALYTEGRWLSRAWRSRPNVSSAIEAAWASAREAADSLEATTAVIVVALDYELLTPQTRARAFSDVHRGVLGAGVVDGERLLLVSPTEVIARNQPLGVLFSRLAEDLGQDPERLLLERRVFSFQARQFHVRLGPEPRVGELLRGKRLVGKDAVSFARICDFERELSLWMLRHVHGDGRMSYRYLPSRGVEDTQNNNMLRQFMATVCLGRIARRASAPGGLDVGLIDTDVGDAGNGLGVQRLAERNLRYNLSRYYRKEGQLGLIQNGDLAYLGSAALALIAIVESPRRQEFAAVERGLLATIDELANSDGSFRTFLKPASRTDNQNFFPGETLLAWSLLYRRGEHPELLGRIFQSYAYYKRWHLAHRLPAFVPWHTQAYCQILAEDERVPKLTTEQHSELLAWVFEMNDWLLDMQSHSTVGYDDTEGRFYHPERPYGPPHASSTGVYLEGLIDAFALARWAQDQRRVKAYREAILLGLRSALQLEFESDDELFYVAERDLVRGGLRTSVYNNRIRVDNVQHVLMAVQKILELFTPEDFR